MTISEMVQMIIRRNAQGFSDEGDVLPAINAVVQMLYKVETPQTILYDATTGYLPLLQTTQGDFEYNWRAGTWRVANILTENREYYDYDYFHENLIRNEVQPVTFGGREYYPYYQVSTTDALEGGVPHIQFHEDPQNTTGQFYVLSYLSHPKIGSDRQQLLIPDSKGAHYSIVLPSVLAWIEASNNGNYAQAIEYIEGVQRPKLYSIMRGGAQGRPHRVTPRPY